MPSMCESHGLAVIADEEYTRAWFKHSSVDPSIEIHILGMGDGDCGIPHKQDDATRAAKKR